jgi:hypothetical protein
MTIAELCVTVFAGMSLNLLATTTSLQRVDRWLYFLAVFTYKKRGFGSVAIVRWEIETNLAAGSTHGLATKSKMMIVSIGKTVEYQSQTNKADVLGMFGQSFDLWLIREIVIVFTIDKIEFQLRHGKSTNNKR